MCGRYGFVPGEDFYKRFNVVNRLERLEKHYNVTPGMRMPVIIRSSPNQVELMRWGLIPFWAKDPKIGYKMINARAEGIENKPAFRIPFRQSRCLIPTSYFFEWKRIGEDKIPYLVRLKDKGVFAFAGLFDTWKDAEGYPLKSFTIITTQPNELVGKIHDRMPVILDGEAEKVWLDTEVTSLTDLVKLLKPYQKEKMEAYPVSKLVNNPRNDSSEITKAV